MILSYEDRQFLALQAATAAAGQVVILQPALFQKLMMLVYQADANNSAKVDFYMPKVSSHD